MILAPALFRDAERLIALLFLMIFDTPPEHRLDRIAIRGGCVRPLMALISLVEENRQSSKWRVGIDVCETAPATSFCGQAIGERGLFLIPDTLTDERFLDNLGQPARHP